MFAIIGIVIVFGCVVAGYLMEHGNLKVLIQPAELIIIGGAAVGTVLIANPLHIIKKIAGGIGENHHREAGPRFEPQARRFGTHASRQSPELAATGAVFEAAL